MSKIKFTEIFEGHIVAESKRWICGLDGAENVPLAVYIEIINMDEATGEPEYADYPFVVSFSIVAAQPHESFNELDAGHKPNKYSLIYDTHSYMGGVPIDHIFIDTDALNNNITQELKARDAKLVTYKADFGALAAQRGKGASITYPQFKEYDVAETWAKAMVGGYADVIMTLVGFTLDQPINLMGKSGWSVIQHQVTGERA